VVCGSELFWLWFLLGFLSCWCSMSWLLVLIWISGCGCVRCCRGLWDWLWLFLVFIILLRWLCCVRRFMSCLMVVFVFRVYLLSLLLWWLGVFGRMIVRMCRCCGVGRLWMVCFGIWGICCLV